MINEMIENLNHVLKMNKDVMTNTGISYIEQVIKELKNQRWHDVKEIPPPYNKNVLVEQECTGFCIRHLSKNNVWYDESGHFDDSGLEYIKWCEIPKD